MQHAIASTHTGYLESRIASETVSPLTIDRNEDFTSEIIPRRFELITSFIYGDRVRQTFAVKANGQRELVLIKGLIEFCRGEKLQANFNDSSLTIELALTDAALLQQVLAEVDRRFRDELQFRSKLKKQIRFEEDYRLACGTIYQ